MRILIVSALFDDQTKIGSARPRSFARWLASFGHDVVVITQMEGETLVPQEEIDGIKVQRVPRSRLIRSAHLFATRIYLTLNSKSRSNKNPARIVKRHSDPGTSIPRSVRVVATMSLLFRSLDDRIWAHSTAKTIDKSWTPDVIFSTYGPLASLWLGQHLAKVFPDASTIVDFRDLLVVDTYPALINRALHRMQREAISRADVVTTVSRGLQNAMSERIADEDRLKIQFIPNGFESSEYLLQSPKTGSDQVLRIGYTGGMYSGRRDASALFEGLASLIDGHEAEASSVEVHYAGKDGAAFIAQAMDFGMESVVIDHGFISKSEAMSLQQQCDVLLVLSWNTREQSGIVTGKIYEYLLSGLPILALTGGNVPGAELTSLINELQAGHAYEYPATPDQYPELRSFLHECYRRRQSGEALSIQSSEKIDSYDYKVLTRKFEELILGLRGQ